MCESYEPIYNTLFSFKNCVDDFYLKHLEKDSIAVDVCLLQPKNQDGLRPGGSIKIGTARLPLNKLMEKDFSFQAQEILRETPNGTMRVGKIFYRLKMRKSLDEALKWYYKAHQMKSLTDPGRQALGQATYLR